MAKRLQRLSRTPPKRLAAMRAFAWRYEENVRFQRRVAGKVLRSSRPPQNRTCEFPRIRLKHLPACRVSREPSTSFATKSAQSRPTRFPPFLSASQGIADN